MRSIQLLAVCGIAATLGCNVSRPSVVTSTAPGADWRKVRVPKNQGVLVKPKP